MARPRFLQGFLAELLELADGTRTATDVAEALGVSKETLWGRLKLFRARGHIFKFARNITFPQKVLAAANGLKSASDIAIELGVEKLLVANALSKLKAEGTLAEVVKVERPQPVRDELLRLADGTRTLGEVCELMKRDYHNIAGRVSLLRSAGHSLTFRKLNSEERKEPDYAMELKTCGVCGAEFDGTPNVKYCSEECAHFAHAEQLRLRKKKPWFTKCCVVCGEEFTTPNNSQVTCLADACRREVRLRGKKRYRNSPHGSAKHQAYLHGPARPRIQAKQKELERKYTAPRRKRAVAMRNLRKSSVFQANRRNSRLQKYNFRYRERYSKEAPVMRFEQKMHYVSGGKAKVIQRRREGSFAHQALVQLKIIEPLLPGHSAEETRMAHREARAAFVEAKLLPFLRKVVNEAYSRQEAQGRNEAQSASLRKRIGRDGMERLQQKRATGRL